MLNISGSNTYTGGTLINSGTIALGNSIANASGLGSGTVTLDGGTLKLYTTGGSSANAGIFSNTIQVDSGYTGTFLGLGRGTLANALLGSGTLTYQTDYVRADVTGDWSSFTGWLSVMPGASGGDFRIASSSGFANGRVNLLSGVTLYSRAGSSNLNLLIGQLSGDSGSVVSAGSGTGLGLQQLLTIQVGRLNTDATFSGSIRGTTSVVKEGSGTWILAGSCTYSGSTSVVAGTLRITGTASGSQSLTISSGATVEVPATGSLAVSGTIANNGTIRFYGSPALSSTDPLINNGILDLINGARTLPANLQNNGVILQASDVRVLDFAVSDGVKW